MPNPVMFSNEEALTRGIERAAWKIDMAIEYFNSLKYDYKKKVFFDHREVQTIAALLIDISSVANASEEEKKAYYFEQLKLFEEEFILSEDEARKARFMERMLENLAIRIDIDWDDERAIENLACSYRAQQAPGTTVEKIPFEVLSMFDHKDAVQGFDSISVKNMIYLTKFASALAARFPNLADILVCPDLNNADYKFRESILEKMQAARDNGTNQVIIDPTESEVMKKVLLGDKFRIVERKPNRYDPDEYDEDIFDEMKAMQSFAKSIYTISGSTVNEYMTVNGYKGERGDNRSDLLLINGIPLTDIAKAKQQELLNNGGASMMYAAIEGTVLRDALCAGSVITVMRPNMLPGGKIAFSYQEVKVNLDALNKFERDEKHNAFRRALDYLNIWKIKPKYPSNAQRDAMQAERKMSTDYQQSIKAAEKKFIDTYNKNSQERRAAENENQMNSKIPIQKNKLYQAFPEVSNAEDDMAREDNINEPVNNNNNNSVREALPTIYEEIDEDKDIEFSPPIIPDDENTKEKSVNIK